MNILLDTHVALWAITDHPRLSAKARSLILEGQTAVWVSVVSLWEIAIKHRLARAKMPLAAKEASAYFAASGYRFLPVEAEHAVALEDLPAHHQDPFDRLLVAQALATSMRLMTHDAMVGRYHRSIILI